MYVLRKGANGMVRLLDTVYGAGMFALFIMICISVILRYLFGASIYGLSEITNYLFVYLTTLGAVNAIWYNEHVGVDFFSRTPAKVQTVLRVFRMLVMLVVQGYFFYLSFRWIAKVGYYVTPLLRFQQRWAQIAVPIGMALGVMMCVFCIILGYGKHVEKEIESQ